jgi:polyphosphate glucokinase
VTNKSHSKASKSASSAKNILVIDVGGTHVKVHTAGEAAPREFDSGPEMTPAAMCAGVLKLTKGAKFDGITIGYPGLVRHGAIAVEPVNLGRGWVGFDFAAALGAPVRLINDAAMQALGSFDGKKMLFLGLGTGLGTCLILEDASVVAMEAAHLPYKNGKSYEDYLGVRGLKRLGKKKWLKHVDIVIELLRKAFEPDEIVLGGGNIHKLAKLPPDVRLGANENALAGGLRLWDVADAKIHGTAK